MLCKYITKHYILKCVNVSNCHTQPVIGYWAVFAINWRRRLSCESSRRPPPSPPPPRRFSMRHLRQRQKNLFWRVRETQRRVFCCSLRPAVCACGETGIRVERRESREQFPHCRPRQNCYCAINLESYKNHIKLITEICFKKWLLVTYRYLWELLMAPDIHEFQKYDTLLLIILGSNL